MEDVYHEREFYSPGKTTNMCFDNRAMVTRTPSQSERTISPPVHVNITETDKSAANKPDQKPTKIKFRRRIQTPHIINLFVIVVVSSLIILIEYGILPGCKMGFTCEDPTISHTFKGELVTPLMLLIGCLLVPLFSLLSTEMLSNDSFKRLNSSRIWFYYKECAIGCILVLLITEVIKVLVGEHRPHFLDVCEPDTGKTCVAGSYIESFTCTNAKYSGRFIIDTSRSFPSGHASVSSFVSFFSAYIIQTRLPTAKTGRLLKPFFVSVCLTWCLVCSLSRITDRRHHWWDVLAGIVLGILGVVYTIRIIDNKVKSMFDSTRISSSTTTLLDVKNKDATSVII